MAGAVRHTGRARSGGVRCQGREKNSARERERERNREEDRETERQEVEVSGPREELRNHSKKKNTSTEMKI